MVSRQPKLKNGLDASSQNVDQVHLWKTTTIFNYHHLKTHPEMLTLQTTWHIEIESFNLSSLWNFHSGSALTFA